MPRLASRLTQLALVVPSHAEDAVAALLETLSELTPTVWADERTGLTTVSIYAPGRPSFRQLIQTLRDRLRDLREDLQLPAKIPIARVELANQDWAESWKKHFPPMEIGRRLLLKPSWNKRRPKRGQAVVILDPGLSFGTGHHATTRFCLSQIVACAPTGTETTTPSLLDMGCGSGILAIAAAQLGYRPVEAFDFDPEAVRVSKRNILDNKMLYAPKVSRKDLLVLPKTGRRTFDLVCANLMADLLIAEAEKIGNRVRPGGVLVVAGVLRHQFRKVSKAFRALGFQPLEGVVDGEWHSGSFRRAGHEL